MWYCQFDISPVNNSDSETGENVQSMLKAVHRFGSVEPPQTRTWLMLYLMCYRQFGCVKMRFGCFHGPHIFLICRYRSSKDIESKPS